MLRILLVVVFILYDAFVTAVFHKYPYRPHIIFIMADDLGWNDVSFHGSDEIPTPNIDALAYNGIILNNLYTQPVCTPSRASLMTGKYPIHLGMQGPPLMAAEPAGLPLEEKILPEYLRDLGYKTKAIGKWHLGFYKKQYTPLYRGFDGFFGYYAGLISYFDHVLQDVYEGIGSFSGYDMRRNDDVTLEGVGEYATDLFTKEAVQTILSHGINATDDYEPLFLYIAHLAVHAGNGGKLLEAPQGNINKFSYISDPNRRTYAAMISKLDDSVGEIVEALHKKNMMKDSIIVFMSDNGAPSSASDRTPPVRSYPNWGSNYPLKGIKGTLWEGGVRSSAFIWSASLLTNPRVSTQLMHVSDWLPTLYTAAGGLLQDLPFDIDGVDQWETLIGDGIPLPTRSTVLINIDEKSRNAAIRIYDWKLVIGKFLDGRWDGYYGDTVNSSGKFRPFYDTQKVMSSKSSIAIRMTNTQLSLPQISHKQMIRSRNIATVVCGANRDERSSLQWTSCEHTPCLYDLRNDPCETNNLSREYFKITARLYHTLKTYRSTLIPQINKPIDVNANPDQWNNTWCSWL